MGLALHQQVLVLNRLWQAVNVCSVRRALTLLFEGHAQVVFGDNDGEFKTFDFSQWRDFSHGVPHKDATSATLPPANCPVAIPSRSTVAPPA